MTTDTEREAARPSDEGCQQSFSYSDLFVLAPLMSTMTEDPPAADDKESP